MRLVPFRRALTTEKAEEGGEWGADEENRAADDESDDAVDDQKGRRRQPESDEARAVHTLRCLYRGSEGAPPSRAQVQRPKKKDLSYCSLNIRGRAPPRGPRSSRGAACLHDGAASGRCWLFYCPALTSLLVLMRPVDKP